MQQMKDIQSRFVSAKDTLKSVNTENAGKEIMVPLTSSVSFVILLCDKTFFFGFENLNQVLKEMSSFNFFHILEFL